MNLEDKRLEMHLMNPFIRRQITDLVTSVDQLPWWQINIMSFQSGKQLFNTNKKENNFFFHWWICFVLTFLPDKLIFLLLTILKTLSIVPKWSFLTQVLQYVVHSSKGRAQIYNVGNQIWREQKGQEWLVQFLSEFATRF